MDGFGEFGGLGQPRSGRNKQPLDDTANYTSRIEAAKQIELEIRDRLATELGWQTIDATEDQDKYDGIDGWITNQDGKGVHIPFQIKARKNSSGNDILWEAIKPWKISLVDNFEDLGNDVFSGKDMKCKSEYLISANNIGNTIRIRNVSEVMAKAKKLTEALVQNYRATGNTFAKTQDGEARVVKDPSQQANFHMRGNIFKINCFISPHEFEWKQDVNLKNPISLI